MFRYNPQCNCCTPVNPCVCTWPDTLTYTGRSTFANQTGFSSQSLPVGWPTEPPYTLTYGAPPGGFPPPTVIQGSHSGGGFVAAWPPGVTGIILPANGWFSGPIAVVSPTGTRYLYGWLQGCQFHLAVLVLDYYDGYTTHPAVLGAGSIVFPLTTCTPFLMTTTYSDPFSGAHYTITGTHGGGDLVPDGSGDIGRWS